MTFYHTSEENKTPISVPLSKDFEPRSTPAPEEQTPPRDILDKLNNYDFDLMQDFVFKDIPDPLIGQADLFCMNERCTTYRKQSDDDSSEPNPNDPFYRLKRIL